MRSGQLRYSAYLQKPTETQANSGAITRTWTTVDTVRCGEVEMTGAERVEATKPESKISGKWRLRYMDGVNSKWRLVVLLASSQLSAAVASTTTTSLSVATASLTAAKGDLLIIDDEIVEVASGEGTGTLTVSRGRHETTAATHSIGATVRRCRVLGLESTVNMMSRNHQIDALVAEVK